MDYRGAGVDIDAATNLVERIKPIAKATHRPGALGGIGGFGALFDPKAAGFVDPILVSTNDGVGTKLDIAIATNQHGNIGIDLVAMCVNDLVVQGAEPLSFHDYFATSKLNVEVTAKVIQSIANGCREAGCVLAGGETAEMPGMYPEGVYDLAGWAMGAAERGTLLPANVAPGDLLVGLASSGLHSNGFSLVRKIMVSKGLSWTASAPFSAIGESFAREFLTPTKIYVKVILAMHRQRLLHAAAHITGGGLVENLPRVLPEGLHPFVSMPWPVPKVFGWLRQEGNISLEEMLRTFNCGIGMVLVCSPESFHEVIHVALEHNQRPYILGHVTEQSSIWTCPANEWWEK